MKSRGISIMSKYKRKKQDGKLVLLRENPAPVDRLAEELAALSTNDNSAPKSDNMIVVYSYDGTDRTKALEYLTEELTDSITTGTKCEDFAYKFIMFKSLAKKEPKSYKLPQFIEEYIINKDIAEQSDGYEADFDEKTNNKTDKKYKKRLFLGEGDFSYTVSLLWKQRLKHPQLATAIIATEFLSKGALADCTYGEQFTRNCDELEQWGVDVQFEIDAKNLQAHFPKTQFHRINFNCPQTTSGNYRGQIEDRPATLISRFLGSADKILSANGRIHIVLPNNHEPLSAKTLVQDFTNVQYRLMEALHNKSHVVVAKRKFVDADGTQRYQYYVHHPTPRDNRNQKQYQVNKIREYVIKRKGELNKERGEKAKEPLELQDAYVKYLDTANYGEQNKKMLLAQFKTYGSNSRSNIPKHGIDNWTTDNESSSYELSDSNTAGPATPAAPPITSALKNKKKGKGKAIEASSSDSDSDDKPPARRVLFD